MKTYKAYIKHRATGCLTTVEYEANSMKEFKDDIHGNGYMIYRNHCKESTLYDWLFNKVVDIGILKEEDYNAYWRFTKIPKTEEEELEMLDKYRESNARRK